MQKLLNREKFISRSKKVVHLLRTKGLQFTSRAVMQKLRFLSHQANLALPIPALELASVLNVPDSDDPAYRIWLARNFPRESDLKKAAEVIEILPYKPVISIIVPVYNPPKHFLQEAIESVLNQVYPYWELCLSDDCSPEPHVREVLEEYQAKDSRIKAVFRTENGHIARASNSALEVATGDFIALLDHDDLLTPNALYEVALLLNRHSDADMIYSDEDKIDENNKLRDPFFKPDWCPDSFLTRMYTCHLGVYRRSLIDEIGGFRTGFEGSQDYDLVLRVTEKTKKIFHIPKILYHWRIHAGSTSTLVTSKLYAFEAAERAITEAFQRRGENAKVQGIPNCLGNYTVRYQIEDYKLVSIVIPLLGEAPNWLDKCLHSIFTKTTYPNYEVVVVENLNTKENSSPIIQKWQTKEAKRFRHYTFDSYNRSSLSNYAAKQTQGNYLLFLEADTEVITPDWVDAMVEQAQRPALGAVGALLLYPDDSVQHAGIVVGVNRTAGYSHRGFPFTTPGYFSQVITINNVSAVAGVCLMCRREVYEQVGGFDEAFAIAYSDVDLCLKMREQGYRNIYLPHVALYHHELDLQVSTNATNVVALKEVENNYFQEKWKKYITNDPCYNPNLTREREDYSIRI